MFYVRLCTRASVHWPVVTAKDVNTWRRRLWLSAATSSSATAWSWWAAGARQGRKYFSFCQKKKQAGAVSPSRTVKGAGGSGVPVAWTCCSQRPRLPLLYGNRVRDYTGSIDVASRDGLRSSTNCALSLSSVFSAKSSSVVGYRADTPRRCWFLSLLAVVAIVPDIVTRCGLNSFPWHCWRRCVAVPSSAWLLNCPGRTMANYFVVLTAV